MSEAPEIRVLLVDDQPLVRMGLRALIASEPGMVVVGEATDGAEGVAAARSLAPDVVLMDIRMPGTDGLQALRALTEDASPRTHVVMLTTFELDEYVFAALEAGAAGFLIKDADPDDILRGIRAAAAVGQRKLVRWTTPGWAHAFVFWGFCVLLLTIIEAVGTLAFALGFTLMMALDVALG
mgnify:CR=1 FL=1